MRSPCFRASVAGVALLASQSCIHAPVVEAQAGYARLAVDGDVGYADGQNNAAVAQDVESAFGLGDDQGSPYLRGKLDLGVPVISLSAFRFEDEGSGVLQAEFGNLSAGLPVATRLDMLSLRGALTFDIELGPVCLSPGIAINWFDLDIAARDLVGIATEDVQLNGPVPLAFVRGEVDLGPFGAVAEVGYMAADVDDVSGSFLDGEAQLVLRPAPALELFVGYRVLGLDVDGEIDGDTFDTDLTIRGWVVGGGVRF